MVDLGLAYWDKRQNKKAEELQVYVMESRRRLLGCEHPDTLEAKNNLVCTCLDQDCSKGTEELQTEEFELIFGVSRIGVSGYPR